jgi:DNA polymerase-3 subunit gamma/tau
VSYYQKYRPKKISELDLTSVRETLLGNLKSGKLSHAYLFVGPRGAGKTSTARILTQVVNCEENVKNKTYGEPCGKCNACISIENGSAVDILEMDAASHRGIDDIRDLREKIRLSPVSLDKKVYIIDEVHMLTNEAFNALLKTLEEPPAHAMFFLCTTEAQKVPETIVSRCTRINFTKASVEEIVRSLKKAVVGENLEVDEEALVAIAEATDGSFREGHKLLEQMATSGKKIDVDLIRDVLGVAGKASVKKMLDLCVGGNAKEVVEMINEMEKSGVKANILINNLLTIAKQEMEESLGRMEFAKYARLIDRLISAADKIKYSPLPLLPIELALLSIAAEGGNRVEKVVKVESVDTVAKTTPILKSVEPVKAIESPIVEEKENVVVQTYDGPLADLSKIKNEWENFLNTLAPTNRSLVGLLRSAMPVGIEGKNLTLEVFYPFHKDQLDQDAKKKIIEDAVARTWGKMTVKCVLGDRTNHFPTPVAQINESSTVSSPEPVNNSEPKQDTVVKGSVDEIFGV